MLAIYLNLKQTNNKQRHKTQEQQSQPCDNYAQLSNCAGHPLVRVHTGSVNADMLIRMLHLLGSLCAITYRVLIHMIKTGFSDFLFAAGK